MKKSERPGRQPDSSPVAATGFPGKRRIKHHKQRDAQRDKARDVPLPMFQVMPHEVEAVSEGKDEKHRAGEVMVLKRDAGDEQPRDELRKIAEEDKACTAVAAEDRRIDQHEQAQQAAPAERWD